MQSIYLKIKHQVIWHLPSSKTKVSHLRHGGTRVTLQPTCAFHRCSPTVSMRTPPHPPAFSWKHIIWPTCIFVLRLRQRNHYEIDRIARKQDDFTAWELTEEVAGRGVEKEEEEDTWREICLWASHLFLHGVLQAFRNEHVCSVTNHPKSVPTEHGETSTFKLKLVILRVMKKLERVPTAHTIDWMGGVGTMRC